MASFNRRQFLVLVALLQVQPFAAHAAHPNDGNIYITDCEHFLHTLRLKCSNDQSKDLTNAIKTQDSVYCPSQSQPVNFNNVGLLTLTDCRYNTLPDNLLHRFTQLQTLMLPLLGLTEFREQDLPRSRDRLTSLSFTLNKLQTIDAKVLAALPKLTELDLQSNEIAVIPDLSAAPQLEKLVLSNNGIVTVPGDAFKGLNALTELWLGHNGLNSARLPYANVPNLKRLAMSGTRSMHQLQIGDFAAAKHLEHLDVSYSGLENVEMGALAPLHKLKTLNLQRNALKKLDFDIFLPQMAHLQELWLDRNNLTELSYDFDQLFPKLDKLAVTGNQLNCTHLEQFLKSLKLRGHAVNVNEDYASNPNYHGIACERVDAVGRDEPAPEAEKIQHGFESGYNVSIFILVLLIGLTNLVICGAIVLVARRAAAFK